MHKQLEETTVKPEHPTAGYHMLFACVPLKRFQKFKIMCESGHRLCMDASTQNHHRTVFNWSSLKFFRHINLSGSGNIAICEYIKISGLK